MNMIDADRTERIRNTRSICPVCFAEVPAAIYRKQGSVVLEKECPQHGGFRVPLSDMPEYFSDLCDAYFTLMPKRMPCRVIDITLTPQCTLQCPICCVSDSFGISVKKMHLEDVKEIVRKNPGIREFLFGHMEPTENHELPEIISFLAAQKKNTHLFTNGLKLIDAGFLHTLKKAGLSSVYLQFDGFNAQAYKVLRGEDLLERKLRILDNLEKAGMPVVLNVTLAKGVNEDQLAPIIDYAVSHHFIRQIGILPLIRLGSAQGYGRDMALGSSDVLRILQRETGGRISVDASRTLQKLMYVLLRFAQFRRCFWFSLFVLVRDQKKGYCSLDELVNFGKLEKCLNTYIRAVKKGAGPLKDLGLLCRLAFLLVNDRTMPLVATYLHFLLFGKRVGIARSNNKLLFIACTDFCDFYKMDLGMSDDYCEEFLYIKNKDNKLINKHTYRLLIDARKAIADQEAQK